MPSKIDRLHIPDELRVALSEEDRNEIIEMVASGISQRKVAIEFEVNRKTIYNILNPDKYSEQLEKRKEDKAWEKYYETERNTGYQKRHRKKKKEFYD